MGRIVNRYDELTVKQLLALLKEGYSVSHEGVGAVRLFTPRMRRHEVALYWNDCKGGRFVVRETAKSA